jgi:signal peptidase I
MMMSSDEQEMEPESRSSIQTVRQIILEFLSTAVRAAILAFLIIYFVAQTSIVHGYSMEPTLHENQRLIIEKVSYRFEQPVRGDVVIVDVPDSEIPLIKRVVGLPGETVAILNGQLFINNQPVTEPYLSPLPAYNYPATTVPEGCLFVMGDNRTVSRDSRAFGPVSQDQILGRAWLSYWPPQDLGLVK